MRHQGKEEAIPGRNSLQVLVRMLCFVPRMMKGTDVFHLEVGWRWGETQPKLHFNMDPSGYWVETPGEGQRGALLPALQSWADHPSSLYLAVLIFRGAWKGLFLSPNLILNYMILS